MEATPTMEFNADDDYQQDDEIDSTENVEQILEDDEINSTENIEPILEDDEINSTENVEPILEEWIPELNMEFESEQSAYEFYNRYAFKIGFGIRKSWKHTLKNSKEAKDRTFCCSRQGIRGKDKRDDLVQKVSAETRCNCLARMKIVLNNGVYHVYEFLSEHNHQFTRSDQTHRLRSHRNLSKIQFNKAEIASSVGIAPKKIFDMMAKEVDGRENLGFVSEDLKNRLHSKRSLKTNVGDTGGVMEYLTKRVLEDANFFYSVQPDEDDLITNIFWADAQMINDYEDFGDVVCFDTTYRKLNDGRPFGLLVGVNNHKQTIIFGAALLYDEKRESFEWLFRTFLAAMGEKKPKTILTDEDAAMAGAIKIVLPETHHRICVWHMYQNACKHLSGIFKEYKNFSADFGDCIYGHENEAVFICAWNEMLEKYHLRENEWLNRLFKRKEKWALVYGRDTFSAAMSTTQRSESMNKELKNYLSVKYDILTFFEHFERMVDDRRYEELKADAKSTQSSPILKANVGILRHAVSLYTPVIFNLFQNEVLQTWNCDMFYQGNHESGNMYKLQEHGTQLEHIVRFDPFEVKIECTCKKFEFVGILCSHALKVLDFNNIRLIPENCILKRWTRDARTKDLCRTISGTLDPKLEANRRYKELCRMFIRGAAQAAQTEETFQIATNCASKLFEDVRQFLQSRVDSTSQVKTEENNVIIATDVVKGVTFEPKGIKHKEKSFRRSARPIGGLEKSSKKKKIQGQGGTICRTTSAHRKISSSKETMNRSNARGEQADNYQQNTSFH